VNRSKKLVALPSSLSIDVDASPANITDYLWNEDVDDCDFLDMVGIYEIFKLLHNFAKKIQNDNILYSRLADDYKPHR